MLSRDQLKSDDRSFYFNDRYRSDTHTDAICLNVSFPNYKLFYRFRRSIVSEVDESHWVVLLLDATLLWELDCAFCEENAAASRVRSIALETKKKPDALESLFRENFHFGNQVISRKSLEIPINFTTNPQAEILVFGRINPRYIKEIVFFNDYTLRRWQPINLTTNIQKSAAYNYGKNYFAPRVDFSHWKSGDSDANDINESKPNSEADITFDDIPF